MSSILATDCQGSEAFQDQADTASRSRGTGSFGTGSCHKEAQTSSLCLVSVPSQLVLSLKTALWAIYVLQTASG